MERKRGSKRESEVKQKNKEREYGVREKQIKRKR